MEKLKFEIPKFSLLPNKPENVVLNTFINATLKTFGFMITLQALTFLYWKRKMPVGKAIKYFLFKEWLFLPFSYYWYRKLKVSCYEEMDKLNVNYVSKVPAIAKEERNTLNINEVKSDIKPVAQAVTEEVKTAIKDKIHLTYRLE